MRIPSFLIKLHQRIKATRVWKHKWKIISVCPFILALFVFLVVSGFNNYAKNQYAEQVASWETRGESYKIENILPSPCPTDEDFFLHPAVLMEMENGYPDQLGRFHRMEIEGFNHGSKAYSIKGRGNFKMGVSTDISQWLDPVIPDATEAEIAQKALQFLEPYAERIAGLEKAALRPSSYVHYQFDEEGYLTPDWRVFKTVGGTVHFLQEEATLHLKAGNPAIAANKILSMLNIATHFANTSNSLFIYMASSVQLTAVDEPLWHGLKSQQWNDQQLAAIEEKLAPINIHEIYLKSMRTELTQIAHIVEQIINDPHYIRKKHAAAAKARAAWGTTPPTTWKAKATEKAKSLTPHGWYVYKATRTLRDLDRLLFYPNGKRINSVSISQCEALDLQKDHFKQLDWDNYTYGFTDENTLSWVTRSIHRSLQYQTKINNMRTAIALERYRLKHQKYPHKLSQLAPDFLPHELKDVITNEPLRYRIKADGTPLIYSIGANEKDDGGIPHSDTEKGDWTWMYTPPSGFTWSDWVKR